MLISVGPRKAVLLSLGKRLKIGGGLSVANRLTLWGNSQFFKPAHRFLKNDEMLGEVTGLRAGG